MNITRRSITQPSGLLPYEYYGGGIYTINEDPEEKIPSALSIDRLYFRKSFNFIPTVSALDIGKKDITLNDVDYLSPYAGGNPPSSPKDSPFDNFTTEFDKRNPLNTHNKEHITFNKRNGDWLAAELKGTNVEYTDCSGYCGTSAEILGEDRMCSDGPGETYTFTGSDVPSWYISNSDGSNASLVSSSVNGNSITLTPTNTGSGLVRLFANVDITTNPCKVGQYHKDIWIGKPAIEVELESNINYVTAYLVGANGTDIESQGITSVVWEELANDGECPANFHANSDFIGIGHGNCLNWRVDVKITVTNDCGTTIIYSTITPKASDPCEDGLRISQNPLKQGVSTNKIIIDPCLGSGGINGKTAQFDEYTVSIHTMYGKQVYYKTQKATEFKISHLPKGFYVARLRTRQGTIVSEKFIIEE